MTRPKWLRHLSPDIHPRSDRRGDGGRRNSEVSLELQMVLIEGLFKCRNLLLPRMDAQRCCLSCAAPVTTRSKTPFANCSFKLYAFQRCSTPTSIHWACLISGQNVSEETIRAEKHIKGGSDIRSLFPCRVYPPETRPNIVSLCWNSSHQRSPDNVISCMTQVLEQH